MLNLPLLGLPYVQQAPYGVLLLRVRRKPELTLKIYNFGVLIWSGVLGLSDHFDLVFSERPGRVTSAIVVTADFGPRVDYITYPLSWQLPTRRSGSKFRISSKDVYASSWWGDIVAQVRLSAARQMDQFGRKPKLTSSGTSEGGLP